RNATMSIDWWIGAQIILHLVDDRIISIHKTKIRKKSETLSADSGFVTAEKSSSGFRKQSWTGQMQFLAPTREAPYQGFFMPAESISVGQIVPLRYSFNTGLSASIIGGVAVGDTVTLNFQVNGNSIPNNTLVTLEVLIPETFRYVQGSLRRNGQVITPFQQAPSGYLMSISNNPDNLLIIDSSPWIYKDGDTVVYSLKMEANKHANGNLNTVSALIVDTKLAQMAAVGPFYTYQIRVQTLVLPPSSACVPNFGQSVFRDWGSGGYKACQIISVVGTGNIPTPPQNPGNFFIGEQCPAASEGTQSMGCRRSDAPFISNSERIFDASCAFGQFCYRCRNDYEYRYVGGVASCGIKLNTPTASQQAPANPLFFPVISPTTLCPSTGGNPRFLCGGNNVQNAIPRTDLTGCFISFCYECIDGYVSGRTNFGGLGCVPSGQIGPTASSNIFSRQGMSKSSISSATSPRIYLSNQETADVSIAFKLIHDPPEPLPAGQSRKNIQRVKYQITMPFDIGIVPNSIYLDNSRFDCPQQEEDSENCKAQYLAGNYYLTVFNREMELDTREHSLRFRIFAGSISEPYKEGNIDAIITMDNNPIRIDEYGTIAILGSGSTELRTVPTLTFPGTSMGDGSTVFWGSDPRVTQLPAPANSNAMFKPSTLNVAYVFPQNPVDGQEYSVIAELEREDNGPIIPDFQYYLLLPTGFSWMREKGVLFDNSVTIPANSIRFERDWDEIDTVKVKLTYPRDTYRHTLKWHIKSSASFADSTQTIVGKFFGPRVQLNMARRNFNMIRNNENPPVFIPRVFVPVFGSTTERPPTSAYEFGNKGQQPLPENPQIFGTKDVVLYQPASSDRPVVFYVETPPGPTTREWRGVIMDASEKPTNFVFDLDNKIYAISTNTNVGKIEDGKIRLN
ncbi:MAG: hypothetical protein AABX33_02750, partial [Nanoarchaeota archaeon]